MQTPDKPTSGPIAQPRFEVGARTQLARSNIPYDGGACHAPLRAVDYADLPGGSDSTG